MRMPMGSLDTAGPEDRVALGMLPIAKRDIERLRHIRQMLPRLADPDLAEDAARSAVQLAMIGRRSTISRDDARAAMRQVLAVTKNPATREAATAILESPEQR